MRGYLRAAGPVTVAVLIAFVFSLLRPRARALAVNSARAKAAAGNGRRPAVLRSKTPLGAPDVSSTAEKSDPALWDKVKHEVTEGDRGGKPGQWSARKAQLAVHDYKEAGGGYKGPKTEDNHLHQWTEEHWSTKSGEPSGQTGERYLPEAALERLTDGEYAETTAKKRADSKKGKQVSAQPKAIARKTAKARDEAAIALTSLTRKDLINRAATAKIAGRTRMSKEQLIAALAK